MVDLNLTLENVEAYDWMNLEEEEQIMFRAHPSIIPHIPEFIFSALAMIAAFAVPILIPQYFEFEMTLLQQVGIGAFLFFGAALGAIGTYLRIKSTFYVFTDDKIVVKKHIFRVDSQETPYDKVQNFEYTQSIVERIINIGTVSVWTAGSGGKEYQLDDIPNPKKANKIISDNT